MAWQLLDRQVSVKVYETQIFEYVFHPIREYVFGLSFLTTLNIYKDYFKGRKKLVQLHKSKFHKSEEVWLET